MSFKIDLNTNKNYNQLVSSQEYSTSNISLFDNGRSCDSSMNLDSVEFSEQNNYETRLKNLINQKNLSCGDELFNYLKLVLDVTLSDIEINAKINEYAPVIESLISEGIEITPDNVQLRIRQYGILLNCGWDSIESFNRANSRNSESLVERLERMYGIKVANMSAEEKAKYLKSYFDTYFSELQLKRLKNASPEEAEKIKANIRKTQLTDFAKLLYNSSKEEYALFRDAIVYLAADNRDDGYIAILNSFDNPEERIEFNCQMSLEQLEIICTGRDQANDLPCEETVCNLTQVYNENLTTEKLEENIESFSKKDILDIKNEYDELVAKIERGEQLTPVENARLDELENKRSFYGNNAVMQVMVAVEQGETELANTSLETAKSLGFNIEDICKCVAKRFSNLSQEAQKVFAKFMDEATNGEFSKVLDEVYNNANNSLNSFEHNSTEQVENSNSGVIHTEEVSGSIGFTQTTIPPQMTTKQEQIVEEVTVETPKRPEASHSKTRSITDLLTVPGEFARKISDFVHEKGVLTATTELLDSGDNTCRKAATKFMDILGDGVLNVIYDLLSTVSGRVEFIKHASASVLSGLKEVDSTTTEIKEQREEELREQGLFLKA